MYKRVMGFAAVLIATLQAGAGALQAETTYSVVGWADFSGPYADVMPDWDSGRVGVINWWNATHGMEIGVRIEYSAVDGRYDPAQIASLWPGVLSEKKPLALLGMGGSDSAAMGPRLPEDKVPMVSGGGGYGFTWTPDPWLFNVRPTLAHEAAMYVEWRYATADQDKPLRVVVIASEAAPAWVDTVDGIKSYAIRNPDKMELVDIIWTTPQPTDMTTDIFAAVGKGIDAIIVMTNTAGSVAVMTARDNVGSDVPVVAGAHNGLTAVAAAVGGAEKVTNIFECAAVAAPVEEGLAFEFYKELTGHGLDRRYSSPMLIGMSQATFLVNQLEEAVRRHGADGVTSENLRETILSHPVSKDEMHGVNGNVRMTSEGSFPVAGLSGYCMTMEDGKLKVLATDVAVPSLVKW